MSWILLLGAIVLDIVATLALASSQGFTRVPPTVIAVLSILASLWLFSLALRTLEVGIAYAVFCGLGIAVTAIIGILWLGEAISPSHHTNHHDVYRALGRGKLRCLSGRRGAGFGSAGGGSGSECRGPRP